MDVIKTMWEEIDWTWFVGKPALVTGLVLFLGGFLLNFKTDAKGTKIFGAAMMIVALGMIVIKILVEKGVLS